MKKSFFLLIGNFLCLIHAFGYTLNTLPQCLHMIEGGQKGAKANYHLFTWIPRGNKYRAQHCAELPLFIGELEKWDRGWFTGDVTWQELQPMRAEFMARLAAWIRR